MNEVANNDLIGSLRNAEDQLDTAQEQLHEMKSEAAGECYAYGDAGVGSFISIARQEKEVQYFRNIYNHLLGQFNSIYSN